MKCKNCNHKIKDKFCSKCGHPAKIERIDSRYISQQVQHLWNIEKGLLYTVKELAIRPGNAIREFIVEDRKKYVQPIMFLILTSVIFTLVISITNYQYSYFNINKIQGLQDFVSTGAIGEWLGENIGYTNLLMGCFIALWIKVFFIKSGYNFYEIVVLLCFVLGEATLILSLVFVIGKLTGNSLISMGAILIFFFYPVWAIGQFFGNKKWANYIKSFIIMVLGNMSYLLTSILIGLIVKILQNY